MLLAISSLLSLAMLVALYRPMVPKMLSGEILTMAPPSFGCANVVEGGPVQMIEEGDKTRLIFAANSVTKIDVSGCDEIPTISSLGKKVYFFGSNGKSHYLGRPKWDFFNTMLIKWHPFDSLHLPFGMIPTGTNSLYESGKMSLDVQEPRTVIRIVTLTQEGDSGILQLNDRNFFLEILPPPAPAPEPIIPCSLEGMPDVVTQGAPPQNVVKIIGNKHCIVRITASDGKNYMLSNQGLASFWQEEGNPSNTKTSLAYKAGTNWEDNIFYTYKSEGQFDIYASPTAEQGSYSVSIYSQEAIEDESTGSAYHEFVLAQEPYEFVVAAPQVPCVLENISNSFNAPTLIAPGKDLLVNVQAQNPNCTVMVTANSSTAYQTGPTTLGNISLLRFSGNGMWEPYQWQGGDSSVFVYQLNTDGKVRYTGIPTADNSFSFRISVDETAQSGGPYAVQFHNGNVFQYFYFSVPDAPVQPVNIETPCDPPEFQWQANIGNAVLPGQEGEEEPCDPPPVPVSTVPATQNCGICKCPSGTAFTISGADGFTSDNHLSACLDQSIEYGGDPDTCTALNVGTVELLNPKDTEGNTTCTWGGGSACPLKNNKNWTTYWNLRTDYTNTFGKPEVFLSNADGATYWPKGGKINCNGPTIFELEEGTGMNCKFVAEDGTTKNDGPREIIVTGSVPDGATCPVNPGSSACPPGQIAFPIPYGGSMCVNLPTTGVVQPPQECMAPGQACGAGDNQCCSQWCVEGQCVCGAAGVMCTGNNQCCSGTCGGLDPADPAKTGTCMAAPAPPVPSTGAVPPVTTPFVPVFPGQSPDMPFPGMVNEGSYDPDASLPPASPMCGYKVNIVCNVSGGMGTAKLDHEAKTATVFLPQMPSGGLGLLVHELWHVQQLMKNPNAFPAQTAEECCALESEAYAHQAEAEAKYGAFSPAEGVSKEIWIKMGANVSCNPAVCLENPPTYADYATQGLKDPFTCESAQQQPEIKEIIKSIETCGSAVSSSPPPPQGSSSSATASSGVCTSEFPICGHMFNLQCPKEQVQWRTGADATVCTGKDGDTGRCYNCNGTGGGITTPPAPSSSVFGTCNLIAVNTIALGMTGLLKVTEDLNEMLTACKKDGDEACAKQFISVCSSGQPKPIAGGMYSQTGGCTLFCN